MSTKEINDVKELRLRFLPLRIHQKIEKYIAQTLAKSDRVLTKETACHELLDQATKKINIPETK